MPQASPPTVLSIGECMVELSREGDGRFALAYGGDTFNTAVYLARAGIQVAYATALGDDAYSEAIRSLAAHEGIDRRHMVTLSGRMPGLYLIETSAGERSFWYWRERAAARDLLSPVAGFDLDAALAGRAVVYFSGITLSIYDGPSLDRLAGGLLEAKAAGTLIAMDSNYRPRGWGGDRERAKATFDRFWALCDIALPTFDDEAALQGDREPRATIDRLAALGVGEIVVKLGAGGALVASAGAVRPVACPGPVEAVDTTAAGDSFNAAYLAARLMGQAPEAAAVAGHRLAGVVIRHRGAIVPLEEVRAVLP